MLSESMLGLVPPRVLLPPARGGLGQPQTARIHFSISIVTLCDCLIHGWFRTSFGAGRLVCETVRLWNIFGYQQIVLGAIN